MLPKGIEDRDADVWEPLLAVAELAGGHWPERARVAAVAAVAADGVKATPSPGIDLLADIRPSSTDCQVEAIFTADLLAELAKHGPALADGWTASRLARMLHGYGIDPDQQGPAHRHEGHQGLPAGVLRGRLVALPAASGYIGYIGYRRGRTTMSEDSGLPTDIEVGDAYALRTFAVKDGRLASIAQRGGHWEDGKCVAICPPNPDDPDHEVPVGGLHVRRLRLLDRRGTARPVPGLRPPHRRGRSDGRPDHRGRQRGEGQRGADRGVVVRRGRPRAGQRRVRPVLQARAGTSTGT